MREEDVRPGMLVKTNAAVTIVPTDEVGKIMLVTERMLEARREFYYGVVLSRIPGHDTWAWFVQHLEPEGEVAAYCHWEFDWHPYGIKDLLEPWRSRAKKIQFDLGVA